MEGTAAALLAYSQPRSSARGAGQHGKGERMAAETVAAVLARCTVAEGLVHASYLPALILHVSAGAVGVLAGAAALLFAKGAPWHRAVGRVFFAAMLIAGVTAVPIAVTRVSFITGLLPAYFAATAWMAARRGRAGPGDVIALVLISALAAAYFILGAQAARSPTGALDGFPASFHYVFGGLAAFAALLDLHAILRPAWGEAARTTRHLWRACMALWSASTSFFFGQMDRFPDFVRGSGFNIALALMPLALMLFWVVRVRLMKQSAVPAFLKAPARIGGALYLTAVAAGLFGLLLPRG